MKRVAPLPLLEFIPALTPRFASPRHLAPLTEVFDRIRNREAVRVVSSVPPRHYKTETIKHAIAWLLLENPSLRIGYATYAQRPAEKRGREIRELYRRAGGTVSADASSRGDWRTGVDDGGVWSTSIGGPITGEGFDVLIIDDPIKDRATAESPLEREKLWDWYTDTGSTRLEPFGSLVLNMTRWHRGDLAGMLIARGWPLISLPAIDGEGRALCPERYSLAELQKICEQIGQYGWQSLFMQAPFAKGGALFVDAHYCESLPTQSMRIRIGIDLAYSTKSHADYSVAVVLGECGGALYVLDVIRLQVTAPDFIARLDALQKRHGKARICGFFGGTEKGVVDTMLSMGLEIDSRPATQDKFTRAQPVAAAWNARKIFLPRQAPWLDAFVSEIVSFTGVGDVHDDQVDALAGAFEGITAGRREAEEIRQKIINMNEVLDASNWDGPEGLARAAHRVINTRREHNQREHERLQAEFLAQQQEKIDAEIALRAQEKEQAEK